MMHKWYQDTCLHCGVKRRMDLIRDEDSVKFHQSYWVNEAWTYERPDCEGVDSGKVGMIVKKVSEYFGVDIFQKARKREVVFPRQVAMCLLHTFTRLNYPEIAALFNSDHASVIHSKRKVWDLCKHYPEIRKKVIDIETLIE